MKVYGKLLGLLVGFVLIIVIAQEIIGCSFKKANNTSEVSEMGPYPTETIAETESQEDYADSVEVIEECDTLDFDAIQEGRQFMGHLLVEGDFTNTGNYKRGVYPAGWSTPPVTYHLEVYEGFIVQSFSDGSSSQYNLDNINDDGYREYRWGQSKTRGIDYSPKSNKLYDIYIDKEYTYWCEIVPAGSVQVANQGSSNMNIEGNAQHNTSVNSRSRCSTCGGTGNCSNPSSAYNSKTYCHGSGLCPLCGGDGFVINPYTSKEQRCSSCSGNGRCQTCLGTGQCRRCGGSGYQ